MVELTLDRRVQGTCGMQTLLKELSCQIFDNFSCQSCGTSLSKDSLWFDHICKNHPDVVNNLSCEEIMSEADIDITFSIKTTKHYFSWHLSCVLPLSIDYILYSLLHYTMHFVYHVSLYANALWVMQHKNFEL